MRNVKLAKIIGLLVLPFFVLANAGCVSTIQQASPEAKGAGLGAIIGAGLGAVLDKDNPWRGAAIGAAAGGLLGGGLAHISKQASIQAAQQGRPVVYQTQEGIVRAEPVSDFYHNPQTQTTCRKIRKRIWQNGKIVEDRIEEVCEGRKTSAEY